MKGSSKSVAIMSSVMLMMSMAETTNATEGADRSPSIEERMQRLEDREAIGELLITYGRLLDKKDLVGYSKLFAEDGVWEGGIGSAKGPGGVYEMLKKVYSRVTPGQYGRDFHIMSDFTISIDGSTATSWSRWIWIVEGEEGKPDAQRSGHYEDILVKDGGQWKFKHRLTVTELPTADKDAEARIFRRDHREKD